MRSRLAATTLLGAALVLAGPSTNASPPRDSADAPATASVRGRIREAGGSRTPVSGAVVMLVDAPADVRPGKPATEPLDPEAIAWTRRAETDADGWFELVGVPVGNVRVVVVAGGYERLELYDRCEVEPATLELYLERERDGEYRTEVASRREQPFEVPPRDVLDGQTARHYPGAGDDPMLAAMNLPGLARSPGGLGMLAFRGGDPTDVGLYLDGHPIPRAFHVLPIAAVLAPSLVDQVELSPGNYAASFGGYGSGLVTITSRVGRRDGIHGQAHADLFDAGATIEGALGKGSLNLGVRRSYVGDILRALPTDQLTAPNFWDYFLRVDQPLGAGHSIGVRALGAGDRLLLTGYFDLRASFHRFDFEYRIDKPRLRALLSPSLRLDSAILHNLNEVRRRAQVVSLRAAFRWQAGERVALDWGSDLVFEAAQRQQNFSYEPGIGMVSSGDEFGPAISAKQLRFGAWLAVPLQLGGWSLVPSLRANLFYLGGKPWIRVDPRFNLRGPLTQPVHLLVAAGMYAIPVVGARSDPSPGYLIQGGDVAGGVADIPEYLLAYFDPSVGGEPVARWTSATQVTHASAGFEAALPWDLDLRALGFFRGARPVEFEGPFGDDPLPTNYGRRTSLGMELLLRRARGRVDGWLGYTLLWSRVDDPVLGWLPGVFDQRHNFVALASLALPRGFRFGVRFRLGSGNPETPVTGREIIPFHDGNTYYRPLRAPRGTTYQPLFHQLDLRLDKTWTLDRTSVGAYLDVQNVYNHTYTEVVIYSPDWATRQSALGLPIYPNLGVTIDY